MIGDLDGWTLLLACFAYGLGVWAGRGWRTTSTELDLELTRRHLEQLLDERDTPGVRIPEPRRGRVSRWEP